MSVTTGSLRATLPANLLFAGWWILVAILPIGHLTGLRNTWTVVIAIATLAWVRRDAWQALPARWILAALLGWCALSIAWSTVPEVSFGKWRGDLLIPLLAYAAAYGYVRRSGSIAAVAGGLVTGLVLLAAISIFAFVPSGDALGLRSSVRVELFPNIERPMPVWYPGVGDASMAASLAAGLLVFWHRLAAAAGRVVAAAVAGIGWAALGMVVLVANNRNAAIGITLVVLACLWSMRRRRVAADRAPDGGTRAWRRVVVGLLMMVAIAAVGVRLETGARERLEALRIPVEPGRSAFVQLTSHDTRPMIWAYYVRLAASSPWAGVGFGRTVPGIHYRTEADRTLAAVEPNAYSHAHNLFLNWWLQTGFVGVALLVAAIVEIVRRALRDAGHPGERRRAEVAGHAIVAIVALMLIRDATDDFLVYGMATLFWVLLGALAGLRSPSEKRVVSAPRAP